MGNRSRRRRAGCGRSPVNGVLDRTGPPIRLGIVGCGGISERHAKGAADSSDATIVACCDVRLDVAEEWAGRYGCEQAYGDYLTMIREHELDAVLLATWPVQHCEQILGCLEAGVRRILCEKSLVTNGAEALEIWSAVREAGALVVEGLMYRHHPAFLKVEELAARGEIGELDNIRAVFSLLDPEDSAADDPNRDWRQHRERGGGVPWDLACYCVDACNRLAGALPRQAVALAGTSTRYGTIARLYGLVEYDNGAVAMIESSKGSDFDHELDLSGAKGRLLLPVAWRIEDVVEVELSRSTDWGAFETTSIAIPAVDAFRLQLDRFAAAVAGTAAPEPTLAESVVDAFTLDALLTSAKERTAVTIELPQALRDPVSTS
jgi:D-xylose 1-dehydrogenase (NADP+, D-xylono-1,5-lactone-forming)